MHIPMNIFIAHFGRLKIRQNLAEKTEEIPNRKLIIFENIPTEDSISIVGQRQTQKEIRDKEKN